MALTAGALAGATACAQCGPADDSVILLRALLGQVFTELLLSVSLGGAAVSGVLGSQGDARLGTGVRTLTLSLPSSGQSLDVVQEPSLE